MSTLEVVPTARTAQNHARYHELDMNVPRLLVRIKELRRCLDTEANRQKLLRLESDLANQGAKLADRIARLKHQIDSASSQTQLETMLAELESQQSRENTELASYVGTLVPGRAQTLLPEMLSEIFLQCSISSPQNYIGGPLDVEMWTNVNILAASVPVDLNIWPAYGGEHSYWSGAVEILHTNCNALGTLKLKLPRKNSSISMPPLFAHPHQPKNLRNLTIHSYDDSIHKALTNIPWIQLSSLEFRVKYEYRFISPAQLAVILAQTMNLTRLLADLGPDPRFGPSPPRVLNLPRLHTLDISWGDDESYYDGIVPHSFIDLFDKLSVPALKSLKLTIGKDASAFVLPALTSLVARCAVALESLHCSIGMWCPISPAASSADAIVGLLRESPSLISFHWGSDGCDLPDLVEALTHTDGDRTRILPKLVDISLRLDSYEGILPGFADMVASRRISDSQSQTPTSLRRFSLKAYRDFPLSDYDDVDHFELPSLSSDSRTANDDALRRLEEFTRNGLSGSVDFRHFDQTLKLVDAKAAVRQGWVTLSKVSGDNSLYCDDNTVWHWVDAQTLYKQQQL
ncbi:hypothetical protein B0H14DRAFT_3145925 [Mycena olivaceomarginata]|nr:hypothetical protein B0H14DRAFT_3145925 [Mycena olivaceomarginata]